jgi:16S rRNA G966 N2-methylase RsmD
MQSLPFCQLESFIAKAFGNGVELFPNVNELFELELAYWEYNCLSKQQILERTAFIKSIDGQPSKHFLLYSGLSEKVQENRTAAAQAYFEEGQFSTGYATHGLFPYRGKFHPQLIKSIINILGIDRGATILDPMAGSGTTNIEAALMGIDSLAVDVSPFCQFMIQTKYEALTINLELLQKLPTDTDKMFDYFNRGRVLNRIEQIKERDKHSIYRLAFLAWLDALGYSMRVVRSNHRQLFAKVLPRYIETVKSILGNQHFKQKELGHTTVLSDSEALKVNLPDASVDCVITSPPYSFAIDYVENDQAQLEFLGYKTDDLKKRLIGLKGKNKAEKLSNYFSDMEVVCSEIARLLKKNSFFVMVIGSNTNQTGGIRLEQTIIDSAKKYNMFLVKSILKPIKGLRNTMKDEYVLFFRKD